MSISIGKRILVGSMREAAMTRDLAPARGMDDLGNEARAIGDPRRNAVIAVLRSE